jgi:hypothetical protein
MSGSNNVLVKEARLSTDLLKNTMFPCRKVTKNGSLLRGMAKIKVDMQRKIRMRKRISFKGVEGRCITIT